MGLGGPLGLELLDGVECLVESESGCEDEGGGMESGARGMHSAGRAPRPDAGAHGAGGAAAPSHSESTRWCLRLLVRS